MYFACTNKRVSKYISQIEYINLHLVSLASRMHFDLRLLSSLQSWNLECYLYTAHATAELTIEPICIATRRLLI